MSGNPNETCTHQWHGQCGACATIAQSRAENGRLRAFARKAWAMGTFPIGEWKAMRETKPARSA